jgi:cytoskeleton protein RodZ
MTEDQEQVAEEAAAEETETPLGGVRLAEARRKQQISVVEIAKELHLEEAKVRALEHNDFDMLGAAVFAKGHLRKYAEIVGVNADDVLADYYKMTRTADLPPVISSRPRVRREISPGPWIALGAVILVGAAAYWWFVVRPATAIPETEIQPAPIEEQGAGTGLPAAAPGGEDNPMPAEDSVSEDTEEAAPEPAAAGLLPAESPVVDDGLTHLSVSFSGDCWTEITDVDGQRLFFEMGRAGRSVELSGAAPISVLFGNVENVSLSVNGSDYPVRPANPGSRTARLTIVEP